MASVCCHAIENTIKMSIQMYRHKKLQLFKTGPKRFKNRIVGPTPRFSKLTLSMSLNQINDFMARKLHNSSLETQKKQLMLEFPTKTLLKNLGLSFGMEMNFKIQFLHSPNDPNAQTHQFLNQHIKNHSIWSLLALQIAL